MRFPEFSGEWKKCKVSDLLDFYSTNSLCWERLEYDTNTVQNLHYGLIHVGLPTMVDLSKDKLPNIKAGSIPKNFELCKEGDIAFADASEDINEVAKAIEFYNLDEKNVICGLHTIHGRDNAGRTVIGFKGYAFSSKAFHHQIRRIAQGTKIFSISTKNFSECYIGIPSKEEQTKIAALLRFTAARIATQNKIIEKLESLIKELTDNSFRDNTRVPMVAFAELYSKAGEGGTPNTSVSDFYEGGSIPFIKIDDLTSKHLVTHKDCITEEGLKKSSAWLIPAGSVIYSNGATIGAISINTYPVCTKQGVLGIIPKDNVDVEYLYYLMTSVYFRKEIHRIITEGTMKTAYLKDINMISCPVPDISVQKTIARRLASITKKIELEQQALSSLQRQKRYLLSNLFI